MRKQIFTGASFAAVIIVAFFGAIPSAIPQAAKPVLPVFEVDPKFPTMPEHMLLGGVGGATADSHGNVWVFHRPHTLEEGNATENGYLPAPPVVEFSAGGKYLPAVASTASPLMRRTTSGSPVTATAMVRSSSSPKTESFCCRSGRAAWLSIAMTQRT